MSNIELKPFKILSSTSIAFKSDYSQEDLNQQLKKNYLSQTPFQRNQIRSSIHKNFIKQKILNLQNKKYDFNIDTNYLMKNFEIENVNNLEKEIIETLKQKAESIEKEKEITDKDNNVNIYPIRSRGISLKRYFSSKEKLLHKNSESVNNFNKNFTKIRKIESSNVIVIQDCDSFNQLNKAKQSGKELSKGKTATDFFKNLNNKSNLKNNAFDNKKMINAHDNNNNNIIFKNQSSDNTEFYFYHKNEDNKNHSEMHNYFGYKKRPKTNQLKASPSLNTNNGKSQTSKKIGFLMSNKNLKNFDMLNDFENKGVTVVNRKHDSVKYKDLSHNIQVVKVDKILLDKVKNF